MSWQNLLTILITALIIIVATISAIVLLKQPRQRDPVQRHYQRFCDKLAKLGTEREINEGPQDFARRACRELPQYGEQINTITQLYVELRYQQQSETSDLTSLKIAVQKIL